MTKKLFTMLSTGVFILGVGGVASATSYDFEPSTPLGAMTISGGVLAGTGGYSAYGFDSQFQWNHDVSTPTITVELTGLSSHTSIDVSFSLAVIDSWDSGSDAKYPADFFNVDVDGGNVFHEIMSGYENPLVSGGSNLYGNATWSDQAFQINLSGLAHTGSTLSIALFAGGGWQGGTDESFAIDNITIVTNNPVPEPATMLLFGTGLLGLAGISISRKKK